MTRPPNVLLVMADQLAATALPAWGNRVVRAPHLQRLGEQGAVFERTYCASPLCTPSRAALMTGALPSRTGAYDNAGELPASWPTFAHHLRLLGYRTQLAGKMHFVGPDQLHGFEERLTTDVYPAGLDWVPDWRLEDREHLAWYHDMSSVARAGPVRATLQTAYDEEVAFRARRALVDAAREPERPFLLVASFTHPHDPFEVPPALWARYDGVEIDLPATPFVPPAEQDAHSARLARMIGAEQPADEARVRAARRGYYAAISLVDDHVGALLATLDELGLAGDTIVMVTSDHGELLGERGLWYKMSPLDPSSRVPLLVHAPGRFAAGRVAAPVSLRDLAPTLVDLAGGDPADAAVDGETLAPLLRAEAGAGHGDVALEYLAEGVRAPQVTLVRGRHKLVRCPGDPDLLLDLEADPHERTNLAADPAHAGVLAELGAAIDARWDLAALDAEVRASQERRRVVAAANATGAITPWDYPTPDDAAARYIRTGRDFWSTLERARLPLE
jgi:choline-sulfatase